MTETQNRIMGGALVVALVVTMGLSMAPPARAAASGRTIYVSQSGSNGNVGAQSTPMRTIQAAVNAATAGDNVVVAAGTYNERLVLDRKGTAAAPVSVTSAAGANVVVSQGITISGAYQRVSGLSVVTGASSGNQVDVTGNDNTVTGLTVHDTAAGASISITGSNNTIKNINAYNCGTADIKNGSHNTISGGTLHHTDAMLMVVDHADYTTIENLDMHDPGQSSASYGDGQGSDGIDFNASHLTIRGCKIHNVFMNGSAQHADAIQWWNMGDDFVFERNVLGSRAKGGKLGLQDQGHFEFESGTSGQTSQRVIIRNNVFLGTDGSYVLNGAPSSTITGQADNWQIVGNTFDCTQELRGDFFANMRNMVIKDNVFGMHSNLQLGSGSTEDYNAYINGASKNSGEGSHSFSVSDPKFVKADLSSATAYGVNADFRPASGSPLLGKGVALASLPTDKAGVSRPNPPAVGAYQDGGSAPAPTPDPTLESVTRLQASDRYGTAVKAAAAMYPNWTGVKDVIVTSGESRSAVDALTASGLAGAYKAPILLVYADSVPSAVSSAIGGMPQGVRLHIVGGPASVSDGVRSTLSHISRVASVDRIYGKTRWDTAAAVAREMKRLLGSAMPATAIVVNGASAAHYFDGLAFSPVAYRMHFPVLLVEQAAVPAATSNVLTELGLTRRLLGGDASAVSEKVGTSLGVASADRFAGNDRCATAVAIATAARGNGWLACGTAAVAATVPDALTVGPVIGAKSGPVLLTYGTHLDSDTAAFLTANRVAIGSAYVAGGTSVLSDSVQSSVASAITQ